MIDLMRLGNEGVCTEYTEKCRYCQQCKVNSHCAKLLVLVREDKIARNSRKVNGYTIFLQGCAFSTYQTCPVMHANALVMQYHYFY